MTPSDGRTAPVSASPVHPDTPHSQDGTEALSATKGPSMTDQPPDLIDLDTGDEYRWRGDGYAHEGDSDFAWSRTDLESGGQRLAEVASLDPQQVDQLRTRYAAGDTDEES